MRMTLVSSVDDSVLRHPFLGAYGFSQEHTISTLLRHALFGDPIIIDSAFFIHNPILYSLIISDNDNILKSLFRHGRVFILSETGSIIGDQRLKRTRNEGMALSINLSSYESIFNKIENELCNQTRNPYVIVRLSDTDIPYKMRQLLVSNLLNIENPYKYGLSIRRRDFDLFKDKLSKNLGMMTPRSSCEVALSDVFTGNLLEDNIYINEIMTYANEAFYIAMAAYLSDFHKMDVQVETIYSNRFLTQVPYKYSAKKVKDAKIVVPVKYIMKNYNYLFDKIFEDKSTSSIRHRYISNKADVNKALKYEKLIYDSLDLDESYSETADNEKEYFSTRITGGIVALEILYNIYKSKIDNRRGFLNTTAKASFIAALTLGAAKVTKTYGPTLVGDKIGNYVAIDSLNEIKDYDGELANIEEFIGVNHIHPLVSSTNESPSSVPMSLLSVDTSSEIYMDWKRREKI